MSADIPAEPVAQRALRVQDEWWPRPSRPGPFRHSVGVRAADLEGWLRPGPHDEPLRQWRCAMLDATGDATFLALPGSEAAGAAVLALVAAAVRHGSSLATAQAKAEAHAKPDPAAHPLALAGRLVVEDLCLVDVSGPSPILTAASLVMPNRWRLADKIGHDLLSVHGPVPGYAQEIGTATDRLMQRLSGDRVMARSNWSITDEPELFQPSASSRVERARHDIRTGQDAAHGLFVRVEYQTVRAVPGVPAVLFTIRTAREPLGALADRPQVAAVLADLIEKQPQEHHRYKGLAPYVGPVLDCLRAINPG